MTHLKIINIGHYIAPAIKIEHAIHLGLYSKEEQIKTKYQSICIENEFYPVEMALKSTDGFLNNKATHISGLTYCSIHAQGQSEFWSPASYIAKRLSLNDAAFVYNLKQGCNGMMLAVQQACLRMSSNLDKSELVMSGDRFNISSFDRWGSDYSILYGDAACSVELGNNENGRFAIEYIGSTSSWELEELHRNDKFQHLSKYDSYDVKRCKKQFLEKYGKSSLQQLTTSHLQSLRKELEDSAGMKITDVNAVIVPNLGYDLLFTNYLEPLGLDTINNTCLWGQSVGHLGCGDCFIGLNILDKSNKLKVNDKILLIGAGAGFSWTFMLVRKI